MLDEVVATRLGRLIRERREAECGCTQDALSARTEELGSKVTNDNVSRVEGGDVSRIGEQKLRVLCKAVGGTLEGFLSAVNLDEQIHGKLMRELEARTASGFAMIDAVRTSWGLSQSAQLSPKRCAELIIDDMRGGESAGLRCVRLVEVLTREADEAGIDDIRKRIGLMFSASVRPVPELFGGATVKVSDTKEGWALQVCVDGNYSSSRCSMPAMAGTSSSFSGCVNTPAPGS